MREFLSQRGIASARLLQRLGLRARAWSSYFGVGIEIEMGMEGVRMRPLVLVIAGSDSSGGA